MKLMLLVITLLVASCLGQNVTVEQMDGNMTQEYDTQESRSTLDKIIEDSSLFRYTICDTCQEKQVDDKMKDLVKCAKEYDIRLERLDPAKRDNPNDPKQCAKEAIVLVQPLIADSKMKILKAVVMCYLIKGVVLVQFDKC